MSNDIWNNCGVEIAMEFSRVARVHIQHCAQLLGSLEIGAGQVPILMVLLKNECISQHKIAEEIHVTPPTISGTLKRMERDGTIIRNPDPNDGRSTLVSLSEKGRDICAKAIDYFCDGSNMLLKDFSPDEKDVLYSFIQRMCKNLEDAGKVLEEKKD